MPEASIIVVVADAFNRNFVTPNCF